MQSEIEIIRNKMLVVHGILIKRGEQEAARHLQLAIDALPVPSAELEKGGPSVP